MIIRYSRLNPLLIDNFNRANNAAVVGPADTGQVGAPIPGTSVFGISANTLYSTTGGNFYWDLAKTVRRMQFKIGLLPAATNIFPILWSDTSTSHQIYALVGTSTPYIAEWVDPVENILGVGTKLAVAGDICEIVAVGNTVQLLINGAVVASANFPAVAAFVMAGISIDIGASVDWIKIWA